MSDQNNGNGEQKKRTNNKLGMKQQHELIEQTKLHLTKFEVRRSSLVEAARILTKACGFPVTPGNVEGVCDEFDVRWKKKRGLSGAKRGCGIGNDRARPIAQDLKKLADQVEGINLFLHNLDDKLGKTGLLDLLEDLDYSSISEKTKAIARSQGVSKQTPPEEDEDAEKGDC